MVMTTSAPFTASAADGAATHPPALAFSTASGTRSQAKTSCPSWARLGATPPPMCPNPMNAMRAILPTLPIPRPLLDERGHSFFLILRPKQSVEQAPLEADARREWDLEGGIDHFLDRDRRERGHCSDRFGDLQRLFEKV